MESLLRKSRKKFHQMLLESGILAINANGVPSNADKSSRFSIDVASRIAKRIISEAVEVPVKQIPNITFEHICWQFLQETFPKLQHLRVGGWRIEELSADYMVAPDIVVYREPEDDSVINADAPVVDDGIATKSVIRRKCSDLPILHASVSAKWTMRSDRAQNSRTEALGLIRNRKGHLPHIAVVTGEPMPGRIASLALGTGDIDCVYHFALYELMDAVIGIGAEDSIELLNSLIDGRRLKDISDLPLDLSV